jgi:hypothetical protein
MMELPRWVVVLALAVLVATVSLAVGPGTASAATKVKSTVTIASGEGARFKGKVNSARKRCRAGRTVKLFRAADSAGEKDELVGTAKTKATGTWTMDGNFLAGIYYAQVTALLVHIHGMAYRCAADFSLRQRF